MFKYNIEEILNDDPLGLLEDVKPKNPVLNEDDRLANSFEEINAFVDKHKKEPQKSNDIKERKLYARLKSIRDDIKKVEVLKPYDRHNLLNKEFENIEEIVENDPFGLLDYKEDIFTLKHIPKRREESDFVARRKVCKEFEKYEPLFKKCHQELKEGKRRLVKFNEKYLDDGTFFILKGLMGYLVKKNIKKSKFNKLDGRTYIVFENGTESNMLFRSLGKGLYEDGYLVTEPTYKVLDKLKQIKEDDISTGYIYILKSKSEDERIKSIKNLYKIGFSTTDVKERVKNAQNDPTYLMAPVSIVGVYEIYNLNAQKLELLLHRFFGMSCLDIDIYDKNNQRHSPREWFIAPLNIIEQVIGLIDSGEIVNYKYDKDLEMIVPK
jgi:hypothetical protein